MRRPAEINPRTSVALASRLPSPLKGAILAAAVMVVGWASPAAADSLHIQNVGSGMCLVGRPQSGELPVRQTHCQAFADQRWDFNLSSGFQQFHNVLSLLCIVTRGPTESGAIATTCGFADGAWAPEWITGTNNYRLRNGNSGLCLTVRGNVAETQAIQATCADTPDQLWRLW